MDFSQVLKIRRSVRIYEEQPIESKKLEKVLEAAQAAPSAGNLQAYKIFVVQTLEKKTALAEAALGQRFIAQAPVVLVFCAYPQESARKYGKRGKSLYALQDATIACAYAQLKATDLGLGSCWVGAFDEKEVREILKAGKDLQPIAILPLGYPAETPYPTPRKSLKLLVGKR